MNRYFRRISNISPFTKFDVLLAGPCFLQHCIRKKYLFRLGNMPGRKLIIQNQKLLKISFPKHLPFLGSGNLALPDKVFLRRICKADSVRILNFKKLLLTFTVECSFPKKSYTNFHIQCRVEVLEILSQSAFPVIQRGSCPRDVCRSPGLTETQFESHCVRACSTEA